MASCTSRSNDAWPKRVIVQTFDGHVPPDYAAAATALRNRHGSNIEIVMVDNEQLWRSDCAERRLVGRDALVLGDFSWTRAALRHLGVPMPRPPDYPPCLAHLLHRRVERTTLGAVREALRAAGPGATPVFVKPADDVKAFSAFVEPRDQMIDAMLDGIPDCLPPLPAELPVFTSDVVDMVAEHRCYVVRGEIRAVCAYMQQSDWKATHEPSALDMGIVRDAVATLAAVEPALATGCAVDFAIVRRADDSTITALIEVNDGYSLGRYAGLDDADYAELLAARWRSLLEARSTGLCS